VPPAPAAGRPPADDVPGGGAGEPEDPSGEEKLSNEDG